MAATWRGTCSISTPPLALAINTVLSSIFQQAVGRGEIDPDHNLELLVDIVFGAMWYRLLTGHASMDRSFADELTEVIIGLVQARPA